MSGAEIRILTLAIGFIMSCLPVNHVAMAQPLKDSATIASSAGTPFRTLWKNQACLSFGVVGYREVSETDGFNVTWLNSNGPDPASSESMNVTTQQAFYSIATFGGDLHKVFPLMTHGLVRLHGEVSGELFFQKIIIPSVVSNRISSPLHYDVHVSNLPMIVHGNIRAGLWIAERFSGGITCYGHSLHVKTDDDRTVQRKYIASVAGLAPYAMLWIPLSDNPLQRWSGRVTFMPYGMIRKDSEFRAMEAEASLLRASGNKSGRVAGIFVRYLHYLDLPVKDEYPGHALKEDVQVVAGIRFGNGGLNNNRGK